MIFRVRGAPTRPRSSLARPSHQFCEPKEVRFHRSSQPHFTPNSPAKLTTTIRPSITISKRWMTRWALINTENYLKEHRSFSERLHHLINTHDRLNAERWLQEMKTYGARPNPAVYQELVRWFADHDKLQDLEQTMEEMKTNKIKPSQFEFDRLVHLYAKHQDRNGLKRTLKAMEDFDMEPNMDTFTEMISAYVKVGDEGEALRTYEHVRKLFGHPNSIQCQEIILMLAKKHDWDNLRVVWDEFERSHEKPTQLLLNTVFDIAFEKMKDMKFSRHLMELLVQYGYDVHPQKYEFLKSI